ncbi:MAG TPA: TolC family protein, partial [Chitinophagaceae bacterium]|nr:TolC family protein [Chitinophagaceae bacterium]
MRRLLGLLFLLQGSFISIAQRDNLDYYVNQGLANSPLLKDYQSQLQMISLDSQLLMAGLKPQVNGISNNSYAPIIRGWGYDEVISNGQQISGLVQVTKSFFTNKNTALQIAGLQLQGLLSGNTVKISEKDLRKTIIDQYIIAFGEQLQLDFNYHINGLLKREDSLLKKLTQDNVFKQSEYLAFVVTLQQQLLNTSQLEIQYHFDLAGLNYLAGILDTAVIALKDPQLSTESFGDYTQSVFYKQFVLDSLKLLNDRSAIELSYRPKVSVFADAGYNSSLTYKPYKNFGASVGINLSIPIYDGHQKKLQLAKIDILERSRLVKRDYFFSQRNQQVLQLMQQLNATDQLIGQINKQIRYTETLI